MKKMYNYGISKKTPLDNKEVWMTSTWKSGKPWRDSNFMKIEHSWSCVKYFYRCHFIQSWKIYYAIDRNFTVKHRPQPRLVLLKKGERHNMFQEMILLVYVSYVFLFAFLVLNMAKRKNQVRHCLLLLSHQFKAKVVNCNHRKGTTNSVENSLLSWL